MASALFSSVTKRLSVYIFSPEKILPAALRPPQPGAGSLNQACDTGGARDKLRRGYIVAAGKGNKIFPPFRGNTFLFLYSRARRRAAKKKFLKMRRNSAAALYKRGVLVYNCFIPAAKTARSRPPRAMFCTVAKARKWQYRILIHCTIINKGQKLVKRFSPRFLNLP